MTRDTMINLLTARGDKLSLAAANEIRHLDEKTAALIAGLRKAEKLFQRLDKLNGKVTDQ